MDDWMSLAFQLGYTSEGDFFRDWNALTDLERRELVDDAGEAWVWA